MSHRVGMGIALAGLVVFCPVLAHADMCDDPCTPCSVESRCPKSGVACYVEGDQDEAKECADTAIATGLELRCETKDAVYCDPGEEEYTEEEGSDDGSGSDDDDGSGSSDDEGCAVRSPRSAPRGLGAALVTFAVAAAATGIRVMRRRGR